MRLIQDERRQSRLEAHTRIVYKLGTDPCVLYPIYSLPPICSILDDWMGSRGGEAVTTCMVLHTTLGYVGEELEMGVSGMPF